MTRRLKNFTTKAGKEKRAWTDENTEQQLGAVVKKYGGRLGGFLAFGLLTIYRHASEIAHGTLFSMWWKLGFTNPGEWPESSQDLDANVRDKAVLAIFTLNFCLYALIAVVSNEYRLRALEGESARVLQELLAVFRPKK